MYNRLPQQVLSFNFMFKSKPLNKKFYSKLENQVEQKLNAIAANRIDLAPDYSTYVAIGFAFAEGFGELGREYFHRAVFCSPKYSRKGADKQYTACLSYHQGAVTVATFFYHCKLLNIN